MDALEVVGTLNYNHDNNYSLKLMQSYERCIVFESIQHHIHGHEPDDVAQELRIHLYNRIHLYDPFNNANFKTWADRVVRNKLIDMSRGCGDYFAPRNHSNIEDIHHYIENELI